ncbi:response regulator transcription factor [Wenzhouxiangella sp. AB-CW3]|uniref:response regulator transcription factor n=1 Tax=Wenzhouxiangella sp. AB-CW3 TaxID=2771012 RepID=UPI00168BD478|nr:response regulator transcription factor [Wenzhouxiangella sp. AB-CW3]QOC24060.1 response regulator transcription factor [Wenzhouxiangella sp. AB-CW3]
MSIRIALADDQALVREGLKALIRELDGIDVVIEAESGEAVLQALADTAIDLILSDIRMPGIDGIALTRKLAETHPDLPVLLLTTFDEDALMLEAAEAGARGFLLKDVSPEELESAIHDVAAGKRLMQPVATESVRRNFRYTDNSPTIEQFTGREIQILRLLAGGYSNKEIARSIHLAEGTVKNYVSDILDKLDTRDRTRAVLKAITLKII